jgi:microsomal dipeptidase-like Zn-dependent dipeptidase
MLAPMLVRWIPPLAVLVALLAVPAAAPAQAPLGNGCFTLAGGVGGPLSFKPTGEGTYMLYDRQGRLLRVRNEAVVAQGGAETAGPMAEWRVAASGKGRVIVVSAANGLGLATGGGALVLREYGGARLPIARASGCLPFPEARLGATGTSRLPRRGAPVSGFADPHLHLIADARAGGRVIHGRAFDRFGIARALGGDARDHGTDGSLDVTGNLLRDGVPFGTHDTQGWPGFTGWPVHDTNTHQQTYWVWLERAWKAGERLVVAQTVEDDELCRVEPLLSHSCDETATIALEVRRLRELENYVDAQSGGPGQGFLEVVTNPTQARRAIERGKLAVVIGAESSDLFGCGIRSGRATCTRADVDRGLSRMRRLGVRSVFIAHWFDNAFAGAALEGGTKGKFINALNRLRTGRWFATRRCPEAGQGEELEAVSRVEIQVVAQFFPAVNPLLSAELPTYPKGRQCNARGLTPLGGYLVRRLMNEGMLIEADHLSEIARAQVLAMASERHYPLVSSHNGTGGPWTAEQLRRLYALGGFAAVTPGTAPELVAKLLGQRQYRSSAFLQGVGLGTDTGGFADLPGPRQDTRLGPLTYPFKSFDGRVTFTREQTGTRVFDFNTDGVAHYGLLADLLADVQRQPRGREALASLFRSAEAYLRTWQRAYAAR